MNKSRREAVDFLEQFAYMKHMCPHIYCPPYTKYGPGQVLDTLPEETREKLKHLKSDDLKNIRGDAIIL